MDLRIASIRRFLYSHYFFGGVRQGVGMLLPVLVVGGLFGNYTTGLVATFGAQCLAIIDQPGGPQRHRTNEMLGGAALGTLTVWATDHTLTLALGVAAQIHVERAAPPKAAPDKSGDKSGAPRRPARPKS